MSLIRKLRDRLQGATLHDLWVETRWVLHHSKRYRRSIAAYVLLGIASIALSLLSSLSSRELINAIVYLQGGGRRVLFCGVSSCCWQARPSCSMPLSAVSVQRSTSASAMSCAPRSSACS